MERLLYISESRLHLLEQPDMDGLVARSLIKNAELNITGALLFTGSRFAQVLEGPAEPLDSVMAAITVDVRHENIMIFDRAPIAARRFTEWSMAYDGRSDYVSRQVLNLLASQRKDRERASERLIGLLYEMAVWRPFPNI